MKAATKATQVDSRQSVWRIRAEFENLGIADSSLREASSLSGGVHGRSSAR